MRASPELVDFMATSLFLSSAYWSLLSPGVLGKLELRCPSNHRPENSSRASPNSPPFTSVFARVSWPIIAVLCLGSNSKEKAKKWARIGLITHTMAKTQNRLTGSPPSRKD